VTDATDTQVFRARLMKARDEINAMQSTRDASAATVKLDQASVGRLTRMDAMQQQAMAKDSQQRAAVALDRIKAALLRCDDGSFGYCLGCDELIDPRRLELDPATTLCVQCARARDD